MRTFRAAVMMALCALSAPASVWAAETSKPPVYEKALVVSFSVDPQALRGVGPRADMDEIVGRLSEAATDRAERSIVRGVRASSSDAVVSASLSGVVRLPVALPDRLDHHRAQSRSEPFVTAVVTLTGADGTVVGQAKATLWWKDLRWTDHHWRGGGRTRRLHHHDRPVDDVLEQAVSKAVDRAVRRLAPPTAG